MTITGIPTGGTGTTVVANPTGTLPTTLVGIGIGSTNYRVRPRVADYPENSSPIAGTRSIILGNTSLTSRITLTELADSYLDIISATTAPAASDSILYYDEGPR